MSLSMLSSVTTAFRNAGWGQGAQAGIGAAQGMPGGFDTLMRERKGEAKPEGRTPRQLAAPAAAVASPDLSSLAANEAPSASENAPRHRLNLVV